MPLIIKLSPYRLLFHKSHFPPHSHCSPPASAHSVCSAGAGRRRLTPHSRSAFDPNPGAMFRGFYLLPMQMRVVSARRAYNCRGKCWAFKYQKKVHKPTNHEPQQHACFRELFFFFRFQLPRYGAFKICRHCAPQRNRGSEAENSRG